MKKVIIAFDIDGTLIDENDFMNVNIVNLAVLLSRMKNVKLVAWSGGGADYARHHVQRLGLDKYFKGYYDKNHLKDTPEGKKHAFSPDIVPDIAIDDIQDCELGNINLIVREK